MATPLNDPFGVLPLQNRKLDYLFIVMFSIFAITSFTVDVPKVLAICYDVALPEIYLDTMKFYTQTIDPLFEIAPPFLLFALSISGFVFGPLYLYFVHGFITGNNGIRTAGLIYVGALFMIMGMITAEELFTTQDNWRVKDYEMFILFNGAYMMMPLLLLARLRKERPFSP